MRDGNGVYELPANSWNPAVEGTEISAPDWNDTADDLAQAITLSIASDGQTVTTQAIPFAAGIETDDISELTTNAGITIDGVLLKDGGVTASGTVSATAGVSVGSAASVTTNTIAEKTSGAGVTVDGVLLKDGRVDWTKAANASAATTTDIYNVSGNYVVIAGNTQIDAFTTAPAGVTRWARFSGTPQLTYNASSMILQGGANITMAAGDVIQAISEGSGNWRVQYFPIGGNVLPTRSINTSRGLSGGGTLAADRTLLIDPSYMQGFIGGLALANNGSDANNDIDFAAGACVDSTASYFMKLASGLTKRLDANWAVGTNQGGLDTGSKATSTWYHCYIIVRSDTGVVDALFSASATSPTLPTNYSYFRRVGAVKTDSSGNILAFVQTGDEFQWVNPPFDQAISNLGTSRVLYAVSTPLGVKCESHLRLYSPNGDNRVFLVCSPDEGNSAPSLSSAPGPTINNTSTTQAAGYINAITDTSSQIAARSDTAGSSLRIFTVGWRDWRGQ